jgi:hypothetical protein
MGEPTVRIFSFLSLFFSAAATCGRETGQMN